MRPTRRPPFLFAALAALGCQSEDATCTDDGCFRQLASERALDEEVLPAPTPEAICE